MSVLFCWSLILVALELAMCPGFIWMFGLVFLGSLGLSWFIQLLNLFVLSWCLWVSVPSRLLLLLLLRPSLVVWAASGLVCNCFNLRSFGFCHDGWFYPIQHVFCFGVICLVFLCLYYYFVSIWLDLEVNSNKFVLVILGSLAFCSLEGSVVVPGRQCPLL